MVRPGENAVDNRIKGILGNKIRQRKSYQKIYVISHDNGYRNLVDKYQRKYNLSAGYLSLKKAIKYCKIIINFVVIFDAIKDWALFTFGRVI